MLKKIIFMCIFSTILFAKPIDLECKLSKTMFGKEYKTPLNFLMDFTIDSDKKTVLAEGMMGDIDNVEFLPSKIIIMSSLNFEYSSRTVYTKVWIDRNTLKITTITGVLKNEVDRVEDTRWFEAIGTCKIRSIKNKI